MFAYAERLEQVNTHLNQNIEKALDIAFRYSQIDGDHHKAWSIDQMVRALLGTEEKYKAWVAMYENNGEYEWDVGITP
jgi:hypothetical protein